MVTIYGLIDPTTKECRYVGKTKNLKKRLTAHKRDITNPRSNTYKIGWLKSLGRMPEVTILEEVPDDNWEQAEIYWINKMKFQFERLTNIQEGGMPSGCQSEESRKKLSETHKARGIRPPSRKGYKLTDEQKEICRQNALRLGFKPPPMGGWNRGIRTEYCPNGHKKTLDNIAIRYRKSEDRYEYRCKICARETQMRHLANKLGGA